MVIPAAKQAFKWASGIALPYAFLAPIEQ